MMDNWIMNTLRYNQQQNQMQLICKEKNFFVGKIKIWFFSDAPKLHGRDHRLLATWSYFFSSNLSCIRLPWSQIICVSLLDNTNKNPNALPDCLEHSIIAFCSSENINQVNIKFVLINLSIKLIEFFRCEIQQSILMEYFIYRIIKMKFLNVWVLVR
jgi:hypothetical protein